MTLLAGRTAGMRRKEQSICAAAAAAAVDRKWTRTASSSVNRRNPLLRSKFRPLFLV